MAVGPFLLASIKARPKLSLPNYSRLKEVYFEPQNISRARRSLSGARKCKTQHSQFNTKRTSVPHSKAKQSKAKDVGGKKKEKRRRKKLRQLIIKEASEENSSNQGGGNRHAPPERRVRRRTHDWPERCTCWRQRPPTIGRDFGVWRRASVTFGPTYRMYIGEVIVIAVLILLQLLSLARQPAT